MSTPPLPPDPFDARRREMVAQQIAARGIRDPRVLEVMQQVPRHLFVPEALLDIAYSDGPLTIGHGQTISQPYMVALMTEALELSGTETILEVGTGSGYQTLILARLGRFVVTVERIAGLSEAARRRLEGSGSTNVEFVVGDGSVGCPGRAPYDRIIVTAGAPTVPQSLRTQVSAGGILIVPAGGRREQTLVKVRRVHDGEGFRESHLVGCVFVPLVGSEGWSESEAGEDDDERGSA